MLRSSARSKRASKRQRLFVPVSSKPATDTVATAVRDTTECSTPSTSRCATPMYARIGESLLSESDYSVHELRVRIFQQMTPHLMIAHLAVNNELITVVAFK